MDNDGGEGEGEERTPLKMRCVEVKDGNWRKEIQRNYFPIQHQEPIQ